MTFNRIAKSEEPKPTAKMPVVQTDLRRRRFTSVVLATLGVTVVTVGVAYWRNRSRPRGPAVEPRSVPANVNQQLSGYTFTQSDQGRRIFTIHAARSVSFTKGGGTVLHGVYVEVFGRQENRHDILRTDECEYDPASGNFFAGGRVEIDLNDLGSALALANSGSAGGSATSKSLLKKHGLQRIELETSKVSFQKRGTLVETDEPVAFKMGPDSGSARGMRYASQGGSLELQSDVVLNLREPHGANKRTDAKLTAGRLLMDKNKNRIDLWGPLEVTQGSERVSAGHGTILLDSSWRRVRQAILDEGMNAADHSPAHPLEISARSVRADFNPADGELQSLAAENNVMARAERNGKTSQLAADKLHVVFSGARPAPLSGTATGKVRFSVQSAPSPPIIAALSAPRGSAVGGKEVLTASQVQFTFHPAERTLRQAQTVGMGHLILVPANPRAGQREVFANPLQMDFDGRGQMEALRGLSQARMLFQPSKQAPPGSLPEETTSDRLTAHFNPATQALGTLEQSGHFKFRQGDRNAASEEAEYDGPSQMLSLTGNPQASDASTHVLADRMRIDLKTNTAEAVGHVRSTHLESGKDPAKSPAGSGQNNLPTNVIADRMEARRADQFVHYQGDVHAWHGQDVVESPSLNIYRLSQRITSDAGVVTTFLGPAAPDSHSQAGGNPGQAAAQNPSRRVARPITIRADHLDYEGGARRANYRGKVSLNSDNATMQADQLEVFFSPAASSGASQVERAVAQGRVEFVQPARHAQGDRAEYFADPGKIVMTGGPPTVDDAQAGFTTGQSLTMFIHDDTILVDGGKKSPTLSKHRLTP